MIRRGSVVAAAVVGLALFGVGSTATAETTSDISDDEWYEMADEAATEVEATDWEAVSAADGCRLVDVEITEVVDPAANAEAGAPEDLAVPVVEREEICPPSLTSDLAFEDGATTNRIGRGSDCSTTSGPGTICVSRSGSYVTTSWRYNGSGTVKAFLKLYRISSSAGGCYTGDALATGSTSSYGNGTRRSLTVYAPGYAGYAGYTWKYVGLGHYTAWGSACAAM